MDEIVIRCDEKCIITVASIADVPKFVTVIRASDGSKSKSTDASTTGHPKAQDERTDGK